MGFDTPKQQKIKRPRNDYKLGVLKLMRSFARAPFSNLSIFFIFHPLWMTTPNRHSERGSVLELVEIHSNSSEESP